MSASPRARSLLVPPVPDNTRSRPRCGSIAGRRTGFRIDKGDVWVPQVIIHAYNDHIRLLSPHGSRHTTMYSGRGSRRCYAIIDGIKEPEQMPASGVSTSLGSRNLCCEPDAIILAFRKAVRECPND